MEFYEKPKKFQNVTNVNILQKKKSHDEMSLFY